MGQANPIPPEDDVDSTLSSESRSSEDVHQPSVEEPTDRSEDNPTQLQPQDIDENRYKLVHEFEDENGSEAVHGSEVENGSELVCGSEVVHGSEIEKGSKVVHRSEFENESEVGNGYETVHESEIENGSAVVQARSPKIALDEIRRQQTHYLYCPKCKSDITKDAELFVKDQDIHQPFVISIPLVFPFPHFHLLWPFLGGLWMKLKTLVLNYLRRLIPSYINLRFLFVAILLLLSIIVLWSSYIPLPPPPQEPLPSKLIPIQISPSQSSSPWPGLLPHSPPSETLPNQPPPSQSSMPWSGLIPHSPPPDKLSTPPSSWPELNPYEKISWLIHLPNIKYLNLLSLVFLALLALCWPHIFPIINSLIPWIKIVPQHNVPVPNPKPAVNKPKSEEVISPPPPKEDPALPRKYPTKKDPAKGDPTKENSAKGDTTKEDPTKEDLTEEEPPVKPPIIPISFISLFKKLIPWEVEILEIVKSIVYGGLIESITSLGVVSSAAASGASTLNVLALGVANLFSGLFLIIHSLYGLITFQPLSHSSNRDQHATALEDETLYKDRLGEFRNYKLHCFIVVVSFIFFGVIPPLFYGLSFKRTDKGHYKAAVVLVVSLICVISLSFGKAWAFRMAKLKTVVQYTGMAVGASAISFITSQIVSDVLEKYGFHELASDYRKV